MPTFEESKNITVDADKIEAVIVDCTNRHIGRILHNCGEIIPPIVISLIKKEMWFCAENILKEGFEITLKPRNQEPWKPKSKDSEFNS
jgi:hypothetical protein